MKKRFLSMLLTGLMIMLLLPAGAFAAEPNVPVLSGGSLEKLAAEKAELITQKYQTASIQYALIDQGKITISGQAGLNDAGGKIPLTSDTMYGIGSTSKMFTAAAVMMLADQGKVNLDTPLIEYIPDFKMQDERYKRITPRMLLNHSSGLPGSSLGSAFLFEDNDSHAHDTLLKQLSAQTLKADPGAFSVYCNDGFTLAEILVERVSGMDYTAFIHQYLTGPLQLSHTKTPKDQLDVSNMAALYYPAYQGQLPSLTANVIGAGGIYSTAEDLVQFADVFMKDSKNRVLSEQSVHAMEQEEYKKGLWPEEADTSVVNYGLGWDSVKLFPFNDYGIKALSKGGDVLLYHASLIVLPEQNMAAAVLSSGGSSSINQMLAAELLLQSLKQKGTIKEFRPAKSFGKPDKTEIPGSMFKYAGYYVATNQQVKVAFADGEMLITTPLNPEAPEQKLVYTAEGAFVSEDGSVQVSFVTEKNGRTYLRERHYATVPELGQAALNVYSAEKLEEAEGAPLPPEIEAAWEKREGKTYYPVNEKYSSVIYQLMRPALRIGRTDDLPGYLVDKKIIDSNTAVSRHQIPGTGSRDTAEYRFFSREGVEYFEALGSIYISEDGVKPLHAGKKSTVMLQAGETARWYTVPKAAAGKTMTVGMPEHGAFAVYDANGLCVNFTVVSGSNQVQLPENGTIVFAAGERARFDIQLKK
ncbi:beta-lactamase family protein [Paenibacillus macerans]|uniref:serine hydrolase domain-containing protein n=1 Tax=Paenibacillus macerans TaxID=44252 RepID=UPI001F0E0FC2|nr:serine hydrolase domain-containing protein [Paenibacillus macerans]UMV46794.1 beta-lactamase family protein [Paenibacillus macerans]